MCLAIPMEPCVHSRPAVLTDGFRKLVLYEGVPLRAGTAFRPGVIERLEAMLASGDVEAALVAMLREMAGMPMAEIELLKSYPESLVVVSSMPQVSG
jgi:hypothetical protein